MNTIFIYSESKDFGEGVLARRAVEKITDQNILAEIALAFTTSLDRHQDGKNQVLATEKITDENLLRKIALNSPNIYAQKAALDKLSDQAVFETRHNPTC